MAKDQNDKPMDDTEIEEKDLDQYGVWVSSESSEDQTETSDSSLLDVEETDSADSLDDLNDLLLNIDEESDADDTIYLEEDDLSLDLDADSEDLMIEQPEMGNIPVEGESSVADFDIPSLDGEEIVLTIGEEEDNKTPSSFSFSPEEKPVNMFDNDLDPPADTELDLEENLFDTPAVPDTDDEISIDLPEEEESLSLDDESTESGDMIDVIMDHDTSDVSLPDLDDDSLPGTESENDFLAGSEITTQSNEPLPELENAKSSKSAPAAFDDVAAVTDDLYHAESSMGQESTTVLVSIEKELTAIRSELTDLRSELQRLRQRGPATADEAPSSDIEEHAAMGAGDPAIDFGAAEAEAEEMMNQSKETESAKGFFDDDEDETIALTGDELDNILNSAEFTEEAGQPTMVDDEMTIDTAAGNLGGTEDGGSSFEEAFAPSEPIEEISLEAMETDDDLSLELDDASQALGASAEDQDPFEGSEEEVTSLANMDIEKELADIENLDDPDTDADLLADSELSKMELEIPEDVAFDTPVSESKIEEVAIDDGADEGLTDELPVNIKNEIRAVLSYMDQLLDALPQEKIAEFAKSEHFHVYKKLFEELGI